jgi:hypothetical protein
MEEKIFRIPAVAEELNQLIEARLHTDGVARIDEILALQERLTGSFANPYYVIVEPESQRIVAKFAGATRDPQEFAEFLRQGGAS